MATEASVVALISEAVQQIVRTTHAQTQYDAQLDAVPWPQRLFPRRAYHEQLRVKFLALAAVPVA